MTKTIKEVFNENLLATLYQLEGITPDDFDTGGDVNVFFFNMCMDILTTFGNRTISALSEYYVDKYESPAVYQPYIATAICMKYLPKWRKTLSILEAEYNPLWNVDGTETVTNSGSDTKTNNLTDDLTHGLTQTRTHADTATTTHADTDTTTHADTDTTTHADTDTTTHGKVETAVHSISGDNGGVVESGRDVTTNSGSDSVGHTGTITDAHTGTITDAHTGTITDAHTGTITDANSGKDTTTHTGTVTDAFGHVITTERQGNIGVTSSQNLIEQEIALRANHNYYDIVIHDILSVISGYEWG